MRPGSLLKHVATLLFPWLVMGLVLSTPLDGAAQDGISVGDAMPQANQSLENANGSSTSLANVARSQGLVVIFWSNQSPWVDRYESRVLTLARDYQDQGIGFALVNSNDPNAFPQESIDEMSQLADRGNYPMPYLVDQGSQVATAFGATRTPHVYVFDGALTLVYHGAIDDSPAEPDQAAHNYLRDALDALVAGESIGTTETRAFGSTIKFYGR